MIREDDEDDNYDPPWLESESVAASSNLESEIPFVFGGKDTMVTAVGYIELVFAVFARGCILILFH